MQKMKETENIKDYADKLLSIINKVRLLGKEFSDDRIVQKILVIMPKKYEFKISSLKESKDLTNISLGELLHALRAQEQRRSMRLKESMQGAFQARAQYQEGGKDKRFNKKKRVQTYRNKVETFPPYTYCKKTNHQSIKCWWIPDIKCKKYGQIGHVERICRSQQHEEKVNPVAQQPEEEQLFVASCFSTSNNSNDSW
jgi:hypothetical protein